MIGHEQYWSLIIQNKAKVRSQKKNDIIWEFFPNIGPTPPFWEPFIQNIARIANAVQVTICLLVSTSVY